MIIDYHSHFCPPNCLVLEATSPDGRTQGWYMNPATGEMRVEGRMRRLGSAADQPWGLDAENPLWSLERRVADMDAAGVDVQALSVPPYLCLYEAQADQAWKLSRQANEGMAEAVSGHPRFVGMATVPLQDPPVAARELQYAVGTLGLAGVEVLSRVGSRTLDDPAMTVFWKAVADLDVPVFLHPANTRDPHARPYYLVNIVGNPTETALGAAHLIFGGVLDRFPGLRIVLAHAGGTLPMLLGRWRHGSEVIPELGILAKPIDAYMSNFWFDTVAHDPAMIEFMIRSLGLKMCVGTDYPFDMGDLTPARTLAAIPALSEEQRAAIGATNLFPSRVRLVGAAS